MDIEQFYIEKGQGLPLILLHGNEPNIRPEELAGIRAKTLVIAGTKDMIKEEHTRLIAASIPDASLVFIKGNHFIANRCPKEFNQAVMDFLRNGIGI